MTTLTNEVATLKTKVANLERKQSQYATKPELDKAIAELRNLLETGLNGVRRILETLLGRNDSGLEGRVSNLEIRVGGVDLVTGSLLRTVQGIQARLGDLLSRVSSLEGAIGQILMDTRNLYNIVTKLQRSVDDLWGQIRLIWSALAAAIAAAIAAAVATIWAAIAGLKTAIALIQKQIAALWAAIRALTLRPALPGRSGRDGSNGRDGKNGKDGSNGRDGKNGKNGKNGKDGSNGRDGKDGKNGKDGSNGRDGKDAEVKFTTITVPVFDGCKADGTGANFSNESVPVIRGLESQVFKEFDRISKIEAAKCESVNAIAILPEHHQIKSGSNIPQLSILWREIKPDGKLGNRFRASTIPHYASGRNPVLSNHKKGSHYARIVLKDNSCITVYAFSQAIAETVAREQLNYVSASLKPNPVKVSLGERKGEELEEFTVKAVRISYFPNGIKNTKPEWVNEL